MYKFDPPETDDFPEPDPFPETPSMPVPETDIGWEWAEGLDDGLGAY